MPSHFNTPNILTLLRLVVAPLILPILLVYLLPLNQLWLNGGLATIMIFFGLTDFFDGYLARKFKQETPFGRLLDPLADKFLVYSVLIALLAAHKIYFLWVLLLIGRELFIMGLRQVALEHAITVHVSLFGKIKTFLQIALLTVIIANPYQALGLWGQPRWNGLELLLLISTLIVSLWSAYRYSNVFWYEYKKATQSIDTSIED